MTVSRVLRNHLNYHYRKSSIKNPKLLKNDSVMMTFIFLKIIERGLYLGLNLIYLDEVGFSLNNSNYYTWRKEGQLIFGGSKNAQKNKLNVILSIDENEIIYGKLFTKTIESEEFIKYFEELLEIMGENKIKNSLFIMDNASFHVSKSVQKYLFSKNIKIVTVVPYLSTFNSIELIFRAFKNITYKEIYNNMKELKNKIKQL